jgi:UDP-GlcNAc:undecaprenyl-phosphate GlcNAc-1-phosphate transferase
MPLETQTPFQPHISFEGSDGEIDRRSYIIAAMETGVFASTLAPLLAGIVSTVTMVVLLRSRSLPLDKPNERSLHVVPVPRTGGIAIITGIVAAALWLRAGPSLLVPVFALAIASFFDDRHALPAAVRLLMHLVAAAIFLWLAAESSEAALLFVLLLAIAWITNLYNFMDGSDGLAGGMAVIGFGTYGIGAWLGGNLELELLAWSIAAAAMGFLIFNFPPAKIFMGDVGSIPLGFLAGAFGVAGWRQGLWPLWFPLAVFAPFIVDASMTLVRRLLRGERVWQAHRQHYYQRLILSGWSHRRTALSEYALMALCAVLAIAGLQQSPAGQIVLLSALALTIALAMWAVDRRWKKFSAAHG